MSANIERIHSRLDGVGRREDHQNSDYYVEAILAVVREEYYAAAAQHRPWASTHEGSAVIREEFEEMWDEVKANNPRNARAEAVQVAATALRFIFDVEDDWSD